MIVSEDRPSWWFGRAIFFRREEKGERREDAWVSLPRRAGGWVSLRES